MTRLHLPPLTRRSFIAGLGFLTVAQSFPFRLALAAAPTERRLLLVILRGAMDGLGAVVPYSDPGYHKIRATLAMDGGRDDLIALDKDFAFVSALAPVGAMYKNGEVAVLHAAATPYRERSHFDAQDLLENGSDTPRGLGTGWLNRALQSMVSAKGLAIGPGVPLALRGPAPVTSWSPDFLPAVDEDFIARVMSMYERDPALHAALAERQARMDDDAIRKGQGPRAFVPMMQKAASLLAEPDGARLASIDIGGWDTHVGQGTHTGRLATNLKILADGLDSFRTTMGSAWNQTAVLVVTEFGRTARPNGTGGTDHGTATASMLLGGRVNGGIKGDWPGLSKLYEDRDLTPANDLRSLLKATLIQHLGIDANQVETDIFPNSREAVPLPNLFRIV